VGNPYFLRAGTRWLYKKEFHQTAIKWKKRNKAIERAYFDHGYTMSEIARHLGLHYATIGRIIKKEML